LVTPQRDFEMPDGSARGIIHLWSLDCPVSEGTTAAALEQAQFLTCGSTLRIVQELARQKTPPAALWLVTRGAQPVYAGEPPASVAQALLWGFGRAVSLELPALGCKLADLDAASADTDCVSVLLEELLGTDSEDQAAFRQGQRYVPRLVPSKCEERAKPRQQFDSQGAYLVTGGSGQVGLLLARWLAQRGVRHLVLVSRTGAADRGAICEIERAGARVTNAAGDVSNRQQMSDLLAQFGHTLPPLRGVIHAAADISLCSLEGMDETILESTLRAKMNGTWILHELTEQMPLDFLVCFSSAASVLGAQHRAHYAAANHFLDAFAHFGRTRGKPVLSINWGNWGTARDPLSVDGTKSFEQIGVLPMGPEDALEAFSHAMGSGLPQWIVGAFDWSRFKPVYEANGFRPLLERIAPKPSAASTRNPAANALDHTAVLIHVERAVRRVLGFDDTQRLDPNRGFFDMGMDSLTSVELKQRLETVLGRTLPGALAFTYPTVAALVDFLSTGSEREPKLRANAAAVGATGSPAPDSNDLSEEALEESLKHELEGAGY
jgi:NAD(P)-dependent dehydrogenase (short-subunit alcohol dehydrogenase family)/acyl carrier protein